MHETSRLVRDAQGGDRAALEDLLARHQGRLYSAVRARLARRAVLAARVAPEDVLQETLFEASRRIGAFEPRGEASFYRWLVGIARRKLAEAERARRAAKRSGGEREEVELAAAQTSLASRAGRRERGADLLAALGRLPARQAEAVRLRYLEGLSVEQAARRLGCTAPAAKALVTRALSDLAQRVRRDGA